MSNKSTDEHRRGWEHGPNPSGLDKHNPGQKDYVKKFNAQQDLKQAESAGTVSRNYNNQGRFGLDQYESTSQTASSAFNQNNANTRKQSIAKRLFSSKKIRRNSALFSVLFLIVGAGGLITLLMSPSLAIVTMKEVLKDSLNDQMRAIDERSTVLLKSKLKDVTKGSCGPVKIQCRFATMTDRQVKKFEKAGIQIDRDMSRGFGGNRGQITQMKFTDDTGRIITVNSASELQSVLKGDRGMSFRGAMMKGYNPLFAGFTDRVALNVMRNMKVSKRVVATGATDEERRNAVNKAVGGVQDSGAKPLIKTTDENGKEIYKDERGNILSQSEVDAAREQASRIDNYTKSGGVKSVLNSALKGVAIQGAADSACTVYNSMRFVSALSKIKKQEQATRYAMAMVLVPADSIKAGDALEEDISFIGNTLTEIKPPGEVLDESKLSQYGSASKPSLISDPEAGKNAFDSPGYRIAAHSDTPDLSLRASRFMVAGGSVALFDGVIRGVAAVVNGGNPDPKSVSEKCKYIQNPAVRFTGLAIGIIAGIGSFGLTTALGIGGSIAVAMALPYIESNAADILAGDVFKDINGIDSGDAAYVGSAGLMGSMAMKRGLKPMNKEEGLNYLNANKETLQKYASVQQYMARTTPFDIHNRFSFLGSLRMSFVPLAQRSSSSLAVASLNIASLIPSAAGALVPRTHAVSSTYFDKCNDQGYASIGIACGPFGELRYGLSDEELSIDPLENANWMATTGNIDPASETGDAIDNGQSWNYTKFLKQCINRTTPMGEYQDEEEGDGSNCVSQQNEAVNKRYRIYTLDKTVDASLDGENLSGLAGLPGTESSPNGSTGIVSSDGWAFPTLTSSIITRGYSDTGILSHKGIDITAKVPSQTIGQPVFAAYDGTIRAVGPAEGYGNWIVIEHQLNGKTVSTVYGGLDIDGMQVQLNKTVQAGQEIGKIGESFNSRGPHLYFELWDGSPLQGGNQINPTDIINATRGQAGVNNV
jgi:murein DD-endopeptidase MepM/ murein hydrolase activator NlpD